MGKLEIFETQDGSHSVFSTEFGVPYHSKYGAIQETRHVFIDAALRFKAVVKKEIGILEIGFGTGLNAYITYLEAHKRNLNIDYITYEAFPLSVEQTAALNYPALLQVSAAEADFFHTMHQVPWNQKVQVDENFSLTKIQQQFQEIDYKEQFDIVYFDAFAPNAQPELWEHGLLEKMFFALRPNGILVTYCAKGSVKRTLKSLGFEIEALPGPPGKREMTRALKMA